MMHEEISQKCHDDEARRRASAGLAHLQWVAVERYDEDGAKGLRRQGKREQGIEQAERMGSC